MRLIVFLIVLLGGCIATTSPETSDPLWDQLDEGLEQRLIRQESVFFQAIRIDPTDYTFRVHYRPNAPLTIQEWTTVLPDAVAIINANFFTVENTVLGVLVSDGQLFGSSYQNRGATFYTTDDAFGIQRNPLSETAIATFSQAVQAFPMLVEEGQSIYNNSNDTAISRRTVIAQDEQGHIILMVTSGFGMSLYELSQYLPTTDLNIVSALNLDGGGSTMMRVNPSDTTVLSFDPVPVVLAVYEKNSD